MSTFVGIDIAKEVHWICAIDSGGKVLLNRKLLNTPDDLARAVGELHALPAPVRIGIDVLGGIASLAQAMLLADGRFELLHVPGLAVNRARQGTVGGESKSDPRDARVIADQVRTRTDLRAVTAQTELDIEIRLLVSRRGDLSADQTRRLSRMHDLLVGIFPELERELDLTTKTSLMLLARFVTPHELRVATDAELVAALGAMARRRFGRELIATVRVLAHRQPIAVPGEALTARLIKESAAEALHAIAQLAALDVEIEQRLALHPDAALIRSLPGMGALMTAEFIAEAGNIERFKSADALAAAGGLAPVLKQSGKSRRMQRPNGGNKGLKRVFYQSAFASLSSPNSRAFYGRKRSEGKRHHQAVIALARRRVNVLWAVLRDRTPYASRSHVNA
ncbi:MAG: IS110 family transposase [Burkholderiales bacterium]|nr:MAG: IS110 family transposase [Burkholderiales bacterium]